ncbi:MAG: MaoC family dehydratase N-terminal domain-containing protein [Dehalococcoidia bacterium]|nr:MaoC family dehydratase N-terminal domain-containing protein [Dehalococcoidia bacterium]
MASENIKKLVGKAGELRLFEVEKGAIKRFADAVGETNLLYWDDDYARNSRYGSIIAPPGFFGWPTKWTGVMPFRDSLQQDVVDVMASEGYTRILDAGIEYEFYRPVRAGDVLAALPKVVSIEEKAAKAGSMFVASIDTTFTNQHGDLIAKQRKNMIIR